VKDVRRMLMGKCLCGNPTRTIVDKTKTSERVTIPQKTCGHSHGFLYLFPAFEASDGLCKRCYEAEKQKEKDQKKYDKL